MWSAMSVLTSPERRLHSSTSAAMKKSASVGSMPEIFFISSSWSAERNFAMGPLSSPSFVQLM